MKVNPLVLAILVLLSTTSLFGYLSYQFYQEKGVAQAALFSCQETNKQLGKTIEKQEKELTLQDDISKDLKQKLDEIKQQECAAVQQIMTLPTRQGQGRRDDEINIDSKLPDTIIRLLHQNSLQRTSSSDAGKSSN